MLLAKSCHKKDHIKTRKTLRIGTLHEYRKTETQEIADKDEGMYKYSISFDGTMEIPNHWFNTFFDGFMGLPHTEENAPINFPGTIEFEIKSLKIISTEADHVVIQDAVAKFKRNALNAFIFCVSLVEEKNDCIDIFPHYDAYWYVDLHRREELGIAIGKLLLKKIIEEHAKGNHLIPKDTPMDNLQIMIVQSKVSYLPRSMHFNSANKNSIEELIDKMQLMSFIKTPNFEHEKEYRFHFTILTEQGQIVVPSVFDVILDAESITSFLV